MTETAEPRTADPRAQRSRAQLTDALGGLLRCSGGAPISVSALCAAAGVSRPTFYHHFATVDDVAVAGVERSLTRLRAELPDGPDAPARLLTAFLTELEADRATWRRTLGAGAGMEAARAAVEAWFAERLAEQTPGSGPVEVRYAAAGFLGAVRAWLLQDDGPERASAAELAEALVGISRRVLGS